MLNSENNELIDSLRRGNRSVGQTQNLVIPVDRILFQPDLQFEKGCLLFSEFYQDYLIFTSDHPEYKEFNKKLLDKLLDLTSFSSTCMCYEEKCKHFQDYDWLTARLSDPIKVENYGDFYIANEGKHRICFAHRSSVNKILAEVTEIYKE